LIASSYLQWLRPGAVIPQTLGTLSLADFISIIAESDFSVETGIEDVSERTTDFAGGHDLLMRGNGHLIICRYGSALDGIRSIAFLAKGLACSSLCPLSFGSDIHSRMILRRVWCSGFMLNPLL
jgi:hypothetical protein